MKDVPGTLDELPSVSTLSDAPLRQSAWRAQVSDLSGLPLAAAGLRPMGRARSAVQSSARAGIWSAVALLLFAAMPTPAQMLIPGVPACGTLDNGYGPYDYRKDTNKLGIVERYHLTPQVAGLIRGESTYIGGDLAYTLHAFPNHHKALLLMQRLAERLRTDKPEGAKYPVECYFERALRFAPDDALARTLYALYLHSKGRRPEALQQLAMADSLAGDSGALRYGLGMAYLEVGDPESALRQAHRARQLAYGVRDLEDKLRERGRWRDPPAPVAPETSASSPAPGTPGASSPQPAAAAP